MQLPPRLADVPKPYREALAAFEALRKCGFTADDIYFLVAGPDEGPLDVAVVLRAQGKELTVTCGAVEDTVKNAYAIWRLMAERLSSGGYTQAELDQNWQASMVYRDKVGFATALMCKGLVPPNRPS
jgi:hypothetical protein